VPLAPSVRKIAAETGVDPAGRRLRQGRPRHQGRHDGGDRARRRCAHPVARPPRPWSARRQPADDAAREERVKMTRLRQTIARRLKEAQSTAAMLTTFNEVDMSAVMHMRNQYKDQFEKRHGVKLGFMGFFVRACVAALKEIPPSTPRSTAPI
jgi:2-oxoglutarate dehydrogenase E2 component (dihydrolipoamide succinyltransferase)